MQLFYSNTSPYSRKVRLVILEKGLSEHVEYIPCNPFDDAAALKAANPLGKVPTLITDDGVALYDSPVICEYLDSLALGRPLIPAAGDERWLVRRGEALADGMLDAAYNIVMERRRSNQEQSPQWLARWQMNITNAAQEAERSMQDLPEGINLAQLSLGAALGYLDFRLADIPWRDNRPELAAWYDTFSTRPSMNQTRPE